MDKSQGYLLVVEDIPDILNLLDTTLKFKGYRVVTARDGQEALDIIQREPPALIVTDILMPKIDGFNLVHKLRIDPETVDREVRFENLEGGEELFPHIYGELDLGAVTGIEPLIVGSDGEFVTPTLLVPARHANPGSHAH